MIARVVCFVALAAACGTSTPSTGAGPASGAPTTKGSNMTQGSCDEARAAIAARRFEGWRGLPAGCTSDALFGMPLDDKWGQLPLGDALEPARSRLLDLGGYYRPLAYVRDGSVVAFDAMNPELAGTVRALEDSLGPPEAVLDWIHGTVAMPSGERVYASKGITLSVNLENGMVIHVTVYAPTTVEAYQKTLRPPRGKQRERKI